MAINYDLLLHLDSFDANIFRLAARNANNYLNALPAEQFEIRVIANAGAVKLFVNQYKELRELAKPLVSRGVRFILCANAIAENQINRDEIWPECEIAPAGVVEIVKAQREGFAYVKP